MSFLDHLRNLCKVGGDQVTRTIGDPHHERPLVTLSHVVQLNGAYLIIEHEPLIWKERQKKTYRLPKSADGIPPVRSVARSVLWWESKWWAGKAPRKFVSQGHHHLRRHRHYEFHIPRVQCPVLETRSYAPTTYTECGPDRTRAR